MSQANASNKIKDWKRGLKAGFISALLAGSCFSLLLYPVFGRYLEGPFMFVCLGFAFPALFDRTASDVKDMLGVAVFWFLAGALIGAFIQNTRAAVGVWLLVYIISAAISIALFANMMN